MSSAFDAIAPAYGQLWSGTREGSAQRAAVWREIDKLFHPGDRILDLGCGTGDDALHLQEHGVATLGIDASPEMVRIARARGVDAQPIAIEHLERLPGPFSGALSNFGALNCVADLPLAAAQLARLLPSKAPLAVCLMSRFAPWESAYFLRRLDWRRASRRWSGRARWRGIDVYYPTRRQIRDSFEPYFQLERRVAIGRGDHSLYIFRRTAC